jgi:hypothetical protein
MDVDKDGRLKPSEILEALRDKLPQAEVRDINIFNMLIQQVASQRRDSDKPSGWNPPLPS